MSRSRSPRVLLYSHDSFGLGHFRRSVSIATALVDHHPHVSALCLTGSPSPGMFDLPQRTDVVTMPCIGKDEQGNYRPRKLPVTLKELISMRSELIATTIRSFKPDVILVDHTAAGPHNELVPVLRKLRRERLDVQTVLGMRDIIDSPRRTRAQMEKAGTVDLLREHYDEILIYGDRAVLDVGEAYHLPEDICAKTSYVGFTCPRPRPERPVSSSRARRVLVSVGGGEDGYETMRAVIAALRGPLIGRDLDVTLVAGPLMGREEFQGLKLQVGGDPRLRLLDFTRDMNRLVAGADLVIGMGGYNTVYESLSSGRRLLVVPRVRPREEQLERSHRLSKLGLISSIHPEDAQDHDGMAASITAALETSPPDPRRVQLPFDGAQQTASRILARLPDSVSRISSVKQA